MKSKKSLFKKFHRKYAFLQTSLFDFLLWRNSNFKIHDNRNFVKNLNTKTQDVFLENEKISFQEYWKNSENKKIRNSIQNMNQEFLIDKKVKKNQTEVLTNRLILKVEQKKLKKIFTKTKYSKFKVQNFYLINFHKSLSIRNSSLLQKSTSETFIPETDYFVQKNLFSFFQNLKIGQFFPMKKHFQQYWIFPLLGFVLFFSSNFEQKHQLKFQSQNNSFPFGTFLKTPTSTKTGLFLKESWDTPIEKADFQKQNFFYPKEFLSPLGKENFHALENEEFQEFANFSLKFFRDSLYSPSFETSESQILRKYCEKTFFQSQKFRNALEQKRNVFNWTWFSVKPEFSSIFQKTHFLKRSLQIPQKGQFFSLKNSEMFVFSQKKMKSFTNGTPIFDFSNMHFFFNDFERNLAMPGYLLKLQDTPFSFQNLANIGSKNDFLKNSTISTIEAKNFFNSLEKEDIQFFNVLFSKKKNKVDFKEKQTQSKTFLFLEKWLETQTFWQIQKKTKTLDSQRERGANSFEGVQNKSENLSPAVFQKLQSTCLMNLDSLYFQKVLQSGDIFQKVFENQIEKNDVFNFELQKKVKTLNNLKNLSAFLTLKKDEKNFQNRSRKPFFSNEKSFSLCLKKQTFDCFLFQYYNKEYKKFRNSMFSEKNKFEKSVLQKILFPSFLKKQKFFRKGSNSFFTQKISKNICFSPVSLFHAENEKYVSNSNFFKTKLNFNTIDLFQKESSQSFLPSISGTQFESPLLFDYSNEQNTQRDSLSTVYLKKQRRENQEFWKNPAFVFGNSFLENSQSVFSSKYFSLVPSLEIFSGSHTSNKVFKFSKISDYFSNPLLKKFSSPLNEENTSFFYSLKRSFFDTFFGKFFKKMKTNFFFHDSKFFFFEKAFFFENTKKEKPFIFQKSSKNSLYFFQNSTTFKRNQLEKNQLLWKKWTTSFVLKKNPKSFLSSPSKISFQKYKSSFLNFQSRKFEKLFNAFFSPLNKETVFSFQSKMNNLESEKTFNSFSVSKLKKEKDILLLKNLLNVLQKQLKNSNNHSFFISQKNGKNQQSFVQFSKFQKEIKNKTFRSSTQENSEGIFSTSEISPTALLKRDGFLFFPESKNRNNSKLFQNKNFQNSFLKRFEKEKSLQKKRRLKKQKLETRRRKKRKRFFPRPLWLRFHLYKKFLKSRHPKKEFHSFFQKNTTFQNGNTNFQTFSFLMKKSQTPSFKEFSCFQKIQPKYFFHIQSNKRWKNVFVQSFESKKMLKNTQNFRFSRFFSEQKKKLFFENSKVFSSKNFSKNQNSLQISKLYLKNREKWGFSSPLFGEKNEFLEKMFFQQMQGKMNLVKKQANFSGVQKSPLSFNREDYKISGEILSEFLRLSWKSYWFQTNFQPYTHRIRENFRKMQKIESQKAFSEYSIFDFFGRSQFVHLFQNFPIFQTSQPECSQNDLIFQKAIFQKFLWYSNIRNSFESSPSVRSAFFGTSSSPFNFQNMQNLPEYNRILYSRISEVFKNFKSAETNEDYFQRDFMNNLKMPKRKNEAISGNLSFLTKSALFFENLSIPSQPVLPAFSLFSSLFNDTSIKPTGDLPTLRALWALQKTNFYQFQETNSIRNLWTLKKRTESLKSFKGTKKVVSFFRKYSGLEKLNSPKFLKENSAPVFSPVEVANDKHFQNEKKIFSSRSETFEKKKLLFFSKGKGNSSDFFQDLDTRSLQKFQKVQEKCSIFGINTIQQNSKISLRYLKFHLFSKNSMSNFASFVNASEDKTSFVKETNEVHSLSRSKKYQNSTSVMKPIPQNSAKSSLNFWWAQQNFQRSELFSTSQTKTFNYFQFLPFSNTNFDEKTQETFFPLHEKKRNFDLSVFQPQLFVFGAIIFHLALVFTLFKIPEIRSVLKFQCLVLFKFFHGFFVLIFSIYDLLKKYTAQAKSIFKKIKNVSVLSSPKQFLPFDSSFSKSQDFQKFVFSRTNFFEEKNLKSLFHPSVFYFDQSFSKFPQKKFALNSSHGEQNFSLNHSKTLFFEIFLRLSKFSNQFSFQNKLFSDFEKKIDSFFVPQKKEIYSFSILLSQKNQFKPQTYFSDFGNSSPRIFSFEKSKSLFVSESSTGNFHLKTLNTVSTSEKFLSNFALSFLFFGKSLTFFSYSSLRLTSTLSGKVLDIIEMLLFSVYKFLEKPAELMIEWIALIFLIEWSSDIATFLPDTFDISFSKSSKKFGRPLRTGSLFLTLFPSNSTFLQPTSIGSLHSIPTTLFTSFEFLTYSNVFSFLLQKRFFYFSEHIFNVFLQPDMDILVRQKKGMIFWDIWAEILLKAAEKYNVNIPSFVTLKEEQELFLEKLLQDRQFLQSLQVEKQNSISLPFLKKEQNKDFFNGEILQQNSLAAFIENFLEKERPSSLPYLQQVFPSRKIEEFVLFKELEFSKTAKQENFSSRQLQNKKNSIFYNIASKNQFFLGRSHFQNFFQNKLLKKKNFDFSSSFSDSQFFQNIDRWSCYQYGTYQGPETDLFIDIYPPKSLKHIQFLKYYEPAQYTVGSLICQIYSGLFSKQVSKNILVIGAPGTAKTLFIQALAGETEMKIITDNAYRYSMVQRGVAVGMKYLRDVFDAIALQTPCFFLIEHIHVIGSKRPLLISDDENVKGIQSSFGLEQQEVHETNQMIYQLNRHLISDYKRPYKGDFSMSIPTNFFLQHFYSNFEKSSASIFQNSQFSSGGINFTDRSSPISPLPIESIEHSLGQQGFAEKEKTDIAFQNSFASLHSKKGLFQSRLQIGREQVFAPPATSPFTILMMKEEKKLKPKKVVQENSWGGLSTDQLVSYQKEKLSVRAKVAVLADITMNLSRGKLDMITDLLVIIDSVRSNRGFVVFATTHLPSLLDPALRRPGRFDETISLAQTPNFLNRFEIFKMHFENSLTTLDFLDLSLFTENFSEFNLFNFITSTKLSLFHQYKYTTSQNFEMFEKNKNSKIKKFQKRKISEISPAKALQKLLKTSFFHDLYTQKQISPLKTSQKTNVSKYFLRNFQLSRYSFLPKKSSHELNLAYTRIGIFLAKSNFLHEPTAFIPLTLDTNDSCSNLSQSQQFFGSIFYVSENQQKLQLMAFLSGKVSEFFLQKTKKISMSVLYQRNQNKILYPSLSLKNSEYLNRPMTFFHKKFSLFIPEQSEQKKNSFEIQQRQNTNFQKSISNFEKSTQAFLFQTSENQTSIETKEISLQRQTDFFWTTFGNDTLWRSATPFLFSIIQKRFFFTKNLLLSKMLFFENKNSRKLPPSPPNSSILMPAKKYENFKRTEQDFVQKLRFSINEKIQMHQQQRFLKQLYSIPIQQSFRSEILPNRTTFFSSSFQELAYLDLLTRSSSSSHFYQKKYLGIRHRFSNLNQWWNGFLPEHNTESTFLSDVDWRTMFQKISTKTSFKSKTQNPPVNQTFEYTMDFPDAEQYYNPRNRRWYFNEKLQKNNAKIGLYWLNFDRNLQYEIYYHYLMQSFHESFQYFDKNREMLDYFVFLLLRKGFLKEFDYLTTISRFQTGNF